jgi:hypothetical protein
LLSSRGGRGWHGRATHAAETLQVGATLPQVGMNTWKGIRALPFMASRLREILASIQVGLTGTPQMKLQGFGAKHGRGRSRVELGRCLPLIGSCLGWIWQGELQCTPSSMGATILALRSILQAVGLLMRFTFSFCRDLTLMQEGRCVGGVQAIPTLCCVGCTVAETGGRHIQNCSHLERGQTALALTASSPRGLCSSFDLQI